MTPLVDKVSEQPPEIITEIFKSASGDTVVLPPRHFECPWVLGHVCSYWRKILWASPSIWSDVTIERRYLTKYPYQTGRPRPSPGTATRESLEYIISKTTSSLSLIIKDGNADDRLYIILAHAGRFRNLTLDYISPEAFVSLLNLPPHSFDHLEKFSAMTFSRDDLLIPNASPLETAPNLRSVNYCIMNVGYIPQCLLLPKENMTEIRVQRMLVPLNVVQGVLLSSPCLVHCAFAISADETPSRGRVTLPSLKSLHLETPHILEWQTLLQSFTTPALEDFSILSPHLPLYPVNSLLERSKCNLKHLSLVLSEHHVDFTNPNGVESLISQLPLSIVTFNLSWIASGLIFWKIQHRLLPRLERIRLNVDTDGLEAFHSLADSYIHEPAADEGRLRKVEICCWVDSGILEDYAGWAKSYKRIEGLDISIFDAETGFDIMDLSDVHDSDGFKSGNESSDREGL